MVENTPYKNQLPWKPKKTNIIKSTSFLPLIDSPNGLPKLKFVESTVFEIMRGQLSPPCMIKIFMGGRGGGWGGGSNARCLKWGGGGGSSRDFSKNILKQGVGKGKSCL